mmetsp:Transcript_47592/g.34862  ORF Transcript_47592/g.34862 Transcript_47592/m.34862 type:complete len:159 (-) Transcript_47592:483-959(-)
MAALLIYLWISSNIQSQPNNPAKKNFQIPQSGGALTSQPKDADGNITIKLQSKLKLTRDTYMFRFGLIRPDEPLGLPIGNHVIFTAIMPTPENKTGEEVSRKYTPTSEITTKGYVDFVIKVYRKGEHPRFPDGGLMSQYLETLEKGAEIKVEGPKGRL